MGALTVAESETEFQRRARLLAAWPALNAGLPKWPQMVMCGTPVTPEQALEIVRRTDSFFCNGYGGNNRQFNKAVKQAVGMPLDSLDLPPGETADWQSQWRATEAWRRAWGCVQTEYVANSWVSCSFIGGPHGWCSLDGVVRYTDNVGKWPAAEDVADDWEQLARAFPFLDLEAVLMSGENCEDHSAPVVVIRVAEGAVSAHAPADYPVFQRYGKDLATMTRMQPDHVTNFVAALQSRDSTREIGVNSEIIMRWAMEHGAACKSAVQQALAPPAPQLEGDA